MSSSATGPSLNPRGTPLLEEYENCLPNFDNLKEQEHLQFVKAIHMISDHFNLSDNRLGCETLTEVQPIIHRLRQLHDLYRDKNSVIASAIRVAMVYIQSYYVDDHDAKIVHALTSLYIDSPIQWLEGMPNSERGYRARCRRDR